MFTLHPQLAADSVSVYRLELCQVRLILDANYPWLILVPLREGVREMHDLSPREQSLLMAELSRASRVLQEATSANKMNVAALGNMVPQLHIHVIARFTDDGAWPAPIWGAKGATAYEHHERDALVARLAADFGAGQSASLAP